MNSYAVVVGIESYQHTGINGVDYARSDAEAFAKIAVERLRVPEENVTLWLDQDASSTQLQEELRYNVRQLRSDDRFFFFYAGHGLLSNNKNRLTAWDTHPHNISGTTVDLEEVLLEPLRESECTHAAVFLDACAADLSEALAPRDLVADMSERQFREFVSSSDYQSVFLSCSPEEKSYSSPQLKHGIWTHHLLLALSGEEPTALERGEWLTGQSLQNYLLHSVTKFIREKTNLGGRQRPYALLSANGTFELAHFPSRDHDELAVFRPSIHDAIFSGEQTRTYKSLPGFTWKKGHSAPVSHTARANSWAQELLADEISDELQTIYSNVRKLLKIKSSSISKEVVDGGGSIDTDLFRFELMAGQNEDDASKATVRRTLVLRVPPNELPAQFDDVFPVPLKTCELPMPGIKGQFSALVDQFDDMLDDMDAELDEDPTSGLITVTTSTRDSVRFDTTRERITFQLSATKGCVDMLARLASSPLRLIAQPYFQQRVLLEKPGE